MSFNFHPVALERELLKLSQKVEGTKEEIPQVPEEMTEFARQFRYIKKIPYSFDYVDVKTKTVIPEARKYLYEIYNSKHPRIMFVKGRQMEMTEYAVTKILHTALKYPDCNIIYTSPTQKQVGRFSRQRLRRWGIFDSPRLKHLVADEPSVQEINIGRSTIHLYTAWDDADSIRNISGDVAIIDECQDVTKDVLPVVESALSHSSIDEMILIGTPKEAGGWFEDFWHRSSQKEWDKEKGVWVQKQAPDPWEGYHISQEMAPWITPQKIEYRRREFPPMQFQNEVLGLFFKGAGRPLTADDMDAVTDKSLNFMDHFDADAGTIYAGVDWGSGKAANTVFMALQAIDHPPDPVQYIVRYIEKVSLNSIGTLEEIKRVAYLIDQFAAKKVVADIGFGKTQVDELKKIYGDRVMGCQYLGNVKNPIQYRNTALGGLIEVDRSYYIDKAVDVIKRKRITIPGMNSELKQWLWNEFICLYLEAEETASGRRYRKWTHDDDTTYDLFHAYNYALIAFEIDTPYRNAPTNVVDYDDSRLCVEFG